MIFTRDHNRWGGGALALLALLILNLLAGCGTAASSLVLPAPTASPVARAELTLPTPAPLVDAPTATATLVITGLPPTRPPTDTPLPWPTPTPWPEATPTPIPPEPAPPESAPPPPTPETPSIRYVVIISIDGLRPDALDRANTPTLDGLRAAGAYSPFGRAVLPSVTLVNHASMLGGRVPAKHGIDFNDEAPDRGKIHGDTLFSVAHQAGFSTAMVVGKEKLNHIDLPGSVDTFIYAGFTDAQVTGRALEVIGAGLPAVLFIHFPDVDTTGHASGWMSAEQIQVVANADAYLGQIVAALQGGGYWPNTLLLVTADHGGDNKHHGGDTPVETLIPWLAVGPGVAAGKLINREIMVFDTAATALFALGLPIPPDWDGQPVQEIFGP